MIIMDVIVEDCKTHPSCPHGPCLMFERHSAKGRKSGRRFFACSACRSRHECSFFLWVDDKMSDQLKKHWEDVINKSKPPFTHDEFMKRLNHFQTFPVSKRSYCKTCSALILPEEAHQNHDVISNITKEKLLQPSSLFQSLRNKRAEAQYFFSDKTVLFITKLLADLGFSKLLLIGTPRIHEHIAAKSSTNLSSLLLDIDDRYMQFFSPDQFCHYNLFNNHFFDGKDSKEKVKQFLNENENSKIAVLIDPPFGGLVNAISYSLKKFSAIWRTVNKKESSENVPLLWFFPYFFESKITENFSDIEMMDYKVEYLNPIKSGMKIASKKSPVRIFTNIPAASFTLPKVDGYRFCKPCQKYVSEENIHCTKCNACTTKHGATYKHCDICQRCFKSSFVHCDTHNKCSLKLSCPPEMTNSNCTCNPEQEEKDDSERCYKCFGYGHKRKYCPVNKTGKKKKLKSRRGPVIMGNLNKY